MDWMEVEELYYKGSLTESAELMARCISKIPIRSLRESLCTFVTRECDILRIMDKGFSPEYSADNYDLYRGKFLDFVVVNGIRSVRLAYQVVVSELGD